MIKDFIVINSIVNRSLNQPPSRYPHFIFDWRSCNPKLSSVFSYAYPHRVTNQEQLYHGEIFGKLNGWNTRLQYVRGLIGFWSLDYVAFTIYNPTTKQSISLPIHTHLPRSRYLFGYDPLKNQYKVLCLTTKIYHPERLLCCKVFTLGDPKNEWTNIECGIGLHYPYGNAVCINGKIYYKARTVNRSYVLVCFDVWSQKFNHVQSPPDKLVRIKSEDSTLLNYQGKLACICGNNNDVDLWVMENTEKQEWFKITFFGLLQGLTRWIRFADVTNPGGEIVIINERNLESNIVYYYDPKRNIRRRFDMETTTSSERIRHSDHVAIWAVTDHVENIMCF
ncbi:putative F-box protein [Cardamine amara subsp. amara]|uniref:F-box protein n=1 Tax=Cardamine amara subsp. amara TaxID=228776 RepID=A0ABD1BYT7_CARAN